MVAKLGASEVQVAPEVEDVKYVNQGAAKYRSNNRSRGRGRYRGRFRDNFVPPPSSNNPMKCRSCQATGHLFRNCPVRFCQACGSRGHDAWNVICPNYK